MIQFSSLPKDKPSQNAVKPGRYTATVYKSELKVGTKTGTEYLNVSFLLDGGGFVNENYFDSDKPFLQYKLGQLLKACKVTLTGEGSLKDVAKVINNKKVIVDVVINDRGYGALDYTGNNDGIYPLENNTTVEEPELDPELSQAIDDDF